MIIATIVIAAVFLAVAVSICWLADIFGEMFLETLVVGTIALAFAHLLAGALMEAGVL